MGISCEFFLPKAQNIFGFPASDRKIQGQPPRWGGVLAGPAGPIWPVWIGLVCGSGLYSLDGQQLGAEPTPLESSQLA